MKILTVISYFYPALTYGGPAKVAYDLTRELSKTNEVTVYTTDVWDEERRIKDSERLKSRKNFKINYFRNIINGFAYRYRFFTAFGMVLKFLREKDQFDIIHIHDVFIIPQIFIGYLAIIFNKEFVVSPHGVLDPVRVEDKSVLKKMVFTLARPVLKKAKMLIATSDDEKQVLKDLGFNKVRTVYNGVDRELSMPTKKYNEFKNGKVLTFFYVGKIHKLKGLKEFINAVSKVNYKFRVIIAGPDDGGKKELIDEIRSLNLQSHVHFIDFVDENEKSELFGLTDLFIYPSHSEGFSISIIESLKYGVPVLITDECNFDEVKEYDAGYLVEVNNLTNNIYNVIKDLNKKQKELAEMGKNARKLLEMKYSIEVMTENVIKIYNQSRK